jgi:hypothetical protein
VGISYNYRVVSYYRSRVQMAWMPIGRWHFLLL